MSMFDGLREFILAIMFLDASEVTQKAGWKPETKILSRSVNDQYFAKVQYIVH